MKRAHELPYRTRSVLAAWRWQGVGCYRATQRGRCGYSIAVLAACLSLAGCVSSKTGVERTSDWWTLNKTTRRDVVAAWGNPDAVLDGVWIWRSRTSAGGKLKASFMMIGATVENSVRSVREHRLRFHPDGTLAGEQVVDYTPGQDKWSINPFD